jgi:hypothetical protein
MENKEVDLEKKVENYLDQKRKEILSIRADHHKMLQSMMKKYSLQEEENFYIPTDIKESEEEKRLINDMEHKNPFYLLTIQANQLLNKKEYLFRNQNIENMIDNVVFQQLAPTSTILDLKNKKPWEEILKTQDCLQILITNDDEMKNLWLHIKDWLKTDWFERKMKETQYFFKAENLLNVEVFYNFNPEFHWRYIKLKSSYQKLKKLEEISAWNELSKEKLNDTIDALLELEEHPIIGLEIQQMIKKITPLWIRSIENMDLLEKLKKESEKLYKDVLESFSDYNVIYKDVSENMPFIKKRTNLKLIH